MNNDDDFPVAELVPVSEWVYNLYRVSYWTEQPELDGKLIATKNLASTDWHIVGAANDEAPQQANWMTWDIIKENVGHPRVVGRMYGQDVHESALSHGRRLTS